MEHDVAFPDFNAQSAHIAGQGSSDTFEFVADKPGSFAYSCLLAGHKEAGMVGKFEVAGRYGAFDDEAKLVTIDDLNKQALKEVREIGAAASWYFDKHIHKLQGNWLRYEDTLLDGHIDEFAVQVQLDF